MIYNKYKLPKYKEHKLIGFAGAPGSGKDSMAETLRAAVTNPSSIVDEMARKYIEKYGNMYSVFQQAIIYNKQLEREKEILKRYEYAFSSSPRFLAYIYACILLNKTTKEPTEAEYGAVSDLYLEAIKSFKDYDFLFICEPLTFYDDDSLRWQTEDESLEIDKHIKSLLRLHGIQYYILESGSSEERLAKVIEVLSGEFVN